MEEWEYIEGHKDLYKDKNYSVLPCLQLEGNKTLMTERIIHLALEIICLLTGERFPPVKSGDHVTIKVSPPPSLTPEKNKEEKILEVTKKIIDLLKGEVNHLINVKVEVTESEEEVYLRTDVQCKEEKVPADESSNNPPERCPRPPYSWDSTHEGHIIPHHHQDEEQAMLTVEAMDDEEEEEGCLVIDLPCDENEAPPNIRTGGSKSRFMPEKRPHPLYSQDSRREDYGIPQHDQDKNMEKVQVVAIKQEKEESLAFPLLTREEEMPAEIGTGVSRSRIIPENGPHPLHSQDSRQEDHNIPQHDQNKNMEKVQVVTFKQEKEENLSLPMLTRKEEMPEEIGPSGSRSSIIPEKRPHALYSWVFRQEDHNVPQHDQNKNKEKVQSVVVKQEKEANSALPMAPRKEEMPAEIGPGGSRSSIIPEKRPRPVYSWVFRQEDHKIPQQDQNNNKEKVQFMVVKQEKEDNLPTLTRKVEMPAKIGPGGSRSSIIPEKRPCPLYSWVFRQEDHNIRQHDQKKNKEKVQVVVVKQEKEEDSAFPMPPKKQGMPMEIGRDGHYVRKTTEKSFPHSSLDHPSKKSDVNPDSPENFVYTSDINLGLYIADISPDSGKSVGGNRAERIYRCAECDKTFCQNAALVRHQRNHTGEKPFQCQDCGKSFTRKSILVEHRRIHTGEKPFSCLECGKCFTQRSGLLIHRKTHRGPMRFPCSGCGTFFTPMVKTEMGHETFCTLCQKSNLPLPTSPESIEYEVEEQAPPEPEIEKKVSRELNLVSQPKTSAGEKRHTCNECKKSFTRRSILVEHQRIHTGEKPFSCSLCWKSFTQRSGLVIHRRIHTREKVYSCTECSCVFTQKAGEENSCPECRNSSTQDPFKVEPPNF